MPASAVSTLPSSTLSVSSSSSRAGSNSVSLKVRSHHVDEIGAAELQRRHVDRDGQARPGLAVEAGAAQHPGAELDDQAAVLGDGDEFARRNFAAGRVRPAAERFDADHGLAALVDDRLVQQLQAIVLDRLAQVAFEQLAVGQVGIHRRVVDAGAVAALVLGAVERHVGIAHDVGGAAAFAVDHRDADRGADHDVLAADRSRARRSRRSCAAPAPSSWRCRRRSRRSPRTRRRRAAPPGRRRAACATAAA